MASTSSTSATQQKFTGLRKRLDQLGYRQPLGIESLPLVERLFADLVHTTESLKKAKLHSTKATSDGSNFDAQIEPYKSDNAKLVKENNELHQQLIRTKEELDATSKDLKGSLRRLEHENADLRFLNNQYVHKVRALEKESKTKTDRILQLQEKNFHAVVQTPGGRKKNIPFRRQRMDLDSALPDGDVSTTVPCPDDPYVADLLQVADDKIAALSEDCRILKEEKDGLQVKVDSFRKQVETRDGEIDRLSRQLEGGRPYDVVALEARNRSNERLISHLNIQIDYLQQKNAELQNQLDDALCNAREKTEENLTLDMRNADLEKELQDVDLMAQRMRLDRDTALTTADKELSVAKSELEKSHHELNTLDFDVDNCRTQNERLVREMESIRLKLKEEMADRQRLDDLLDKVQEDKRRLSTRVNKLTANERELVLEMDRLKHRNGVVRKRAKSPNRVEAFMKGVEEERDYWKGEVEVLQKLMRSMKSTAPRSRSISPNRSRPRSRASSPNKSRSRNSSPLNTPVKEDKKALHFEAIVRVLEDERDHYKRECDILRTLRSRPSSPTRSMTKLSDDSELVRVQRERDELQGLLEKFERHMAEIQSNLKVLTSERDKLNTMYEETKDELDRLRREVVRSPKSPKTSLAAQAVLRRVENERDDAMTELRRIGSERDSLRERLKIATETHLADRARLEQRIEDFDVAIKTAQISSDETDSRSRSMQKLVDNLEAKAKDLNLQLAETREEAAKQKATATQMRLLAEQTERSLEDAQLRLNRKEAELKNSSKQLMDTEDRVSSMSHYPEEVSKLRMTINALDREKDNLQMEVDDKAEKLVMLEEELLLKEKTISDLRYNINDMDTALGRTSDTCTAKDREILSLRRQLDGVSEDLSDTGRAREVALRENRRLQEDLATMTKENQDLNADLAETVDEREQLKAQVQDYIIEVKRIEDLLSTKEQERTNLLEQYRCLTLEAEQYETKSHQLESEGSNMRLEMMTKESELRHLRERGDRLERELQDSDLDEFGPTEHISTEHAYEMQVSSLTKSIAHLEEMLRASENEKQQLMLDLSAVRDLCAKLEATKDSLQRQLTSRTLDHEKLQNILDDMKQETHMLRSQVSTERSSVMNLEGLLQNNREKEFRTEFEIQESGAEIQLLKDRLALNETKIDSQSRELAALRIKSIETDSECDRLRRQLTHERFERERAVQELRRHGLAPPGEGASRLSGHSPNTSRARSPSPYRSRSKSPSSRVRSPIRYADDDNTTDKDTCEEDSDSSLSSRDAHWELLRGELSSE